MKKFAITGMAGRFPGATSVEGLWNGLLEGRWTATEVPANRFDIEKWYAPTPGVPNKTYVRLGGFLDDVDRFDARFFGLSPREASFMDPQQRLLLEVANEAFEDAGIAAGGNAGVFIGISGSEYEHRLLSQQHDLTALVGASSRNAASSRISHHFKLTGPSVVVDTDRSSSLVAILSACRALERGECSVAVAGGANLILSPRPTVAFAQVRALAADGRCKFGDASADGFVRSEAIGLVVLRPLDDAIRDRDRIYAVILGGATNHNGGEATDLMRTSIVAQERLFRAACEDAGVGPGDIGYVEAHGTGTPAGDPVELTAIGAVYGAVRAAKEPVLVGSIKTNIGHTEAAAGVCGLIKAALIAQSRIVPRSLHFETPNPAIPFDKLGLEIPKSQRVLRGTGEQLVAVSSFGLTGTNAHVILGPAQEYVGRSLGAERNLRASPNEILPVPVSANDDGTLARGAERLLHFINRPESEARNTEIHDIAQTASVRRAHYSTRMVVLARSTGELSSRLASFLAGQHSDDVFFGQRESKPRRVAFICPGQGGQWPAMGAILQEREPTFARSMKEIDAAVQEILGWSLLERLSDARQSGTLDRIDLIQPALFAISVSLARLWQSWGLSPEVVIGTSMGETAAAHISGALNLTDAVRVIGRRSRLIGTTVAGASGMVSVQLPAEQLQARIDEWGMAVSIAVFNGPSSNVLAGTISDLQSAVSLLERSGAVCRWIRTDIGSHSTCVDGLRDSMFTELADLQPTTPSLRMLSTVDLADISAPPDNAYWWRNLREPVRFAQAVDRLLADGIDTFVELSPHPVLLNHILDIAFTGTKRVAVVGSLRRECDDRESLLRAFAELHVHGTELRWGALFPVSTTQVPLPGYPWQRDSHWIESSDAFTSNQGGTLAPPEENTIDAAGQRESMTSNAFRARVERALPRERPDLLVDAVRDVAAPILGMALRRKGDLDTAFRDLGMGSAMGVDLCARLSRVVGTPVPPAIVYSAATIRSLASWIAGQMGFKDVQVQLDNISVRRHHASTGTDSTDDPIAIVAMSCRFPGDADDPESFWELLSSGRDVIQEVPASRFDINAVFNPDPDQPGNTYARFGAFLRNLDQFDPSFFGISPREARSIDPQERLLLECSWEALERARMPATQLAGTRTGVFVGIWATDYRERALADTAAVDAYTLLGNTPSAIAGRLSYWLGLEGPNLAVDTACSSSLVALHLACRSLHAAECDQVLVGGTNVILSPSGYIMLSRLRALSPSGRCRTFSNSADGYVRAEGCGVLLLKRLSDAERDEDTILAVIRGTAVNQDGASNGFTAPNGKAQRQLIQDALADAGLKPADVDYVECHGTGTPLGDPIEVQALAEAYAQGRRSEAPLFVGSVKSNIGHTEAAAGVAGLIKTVMALHKEKLPATLHLSELNSKVPWDKLPISVVDREISWARRTGHTRRAGISSFGISGTNAHVIVEEAPKRSAGQTVAAAEEGVVSAIPLVFSGHTEGALRANVGRIASHLSRGDISLLDLGYSLARTRNALRVRAAAATSVGAPVTEVVSRLEAFARGERPAGFVEGSEAGRLAGLCVLFTGQGSQRPQMGATLRAKDRGFRRHFDEIIGAFDGLLELPLEAVLLGGESNLLDQTMYAQPALFALELALFRRYEELGVSASVLVGHSIGELTAVCASGALGLSDAARLVAARGRLMQQCRSDGAMLSVRASESEVAAALVKGVEIAGVNGPTQTVVSGDSSAIEYLTEHFSRQGVKVNRLRVSHAFHSAHMDAALNELEAVASSCKFQPPRIGIVSNVTGRRIALQEISTPSYWARQVRSAVRFFDCISTAQSEGAGIFLECGPHGVLCALAASCVPEEAANTFVPALRAEVSEEVAFATSIGTMFAYGIEIAWNEYFAGTSARPVDLPTYAFQRERHWVNKSTSSVDASSLGIAEMDHEILRAHVDLPDGSHLFTGALSRTRPMFASEHQVFEDVLYPGAGSLELCLFASGVLHAGGVRELVLSSPLILEHSACTVQVQVGPAISGSGRNVSVRSRPRNGDGPWVEHATGVIGDVQTSAPTPPQNWPPSSAREVSLDGLYERLSQRGLRYGESFRGLERVWESSDTIYAEVSVADELLEQSFLIHPCLLDSSLHAILSVISEKTISLPFAWRDVVFHGRKASHARAIVRLISDDRYSLSLFDNDQRPILDVGELTIRGATAGQVRSTSTDHPALYAIVEEVIDTKGKVDVLEVPSSRELALIRPGSSVLVVQWGAGTSAGSEVAREVARGLTWVKDYLATPALASRTVVWMTQGGVALREQDPVSLSSAGLWALGRTLQAEHPELRFILLDTSEPLSRSRMCEVLGSLPTDECQVAVRGEQLLALRLEEQHNTAELPTPASGPWSLSVTGPGDRDAVHLPASKTDRRRLNEGEVRIRVHSAFLGSTDIKLAQEASTERTRVFGLEGAGSVEEVNSHDSSLKVGDRVFGLFSEASGSHAVADVRTVTTVPQNLTYAESATTALPFLVATYAVQHLGKLKAGERVLVRSASDDIGLAAIQVARFIGADVHTIENDKNQVLVQTMGVPPSRIEISNDPNIIQSTLGDASGTGFDVVLSGPLDDSGELSPGLLRKGGRLIDFRQSGNSIESDSQSSLMRIKYHSIDLLNIAPSLIETMLSEIRDRLATGAYKALPYEWWDFGKTGAVSGRISCGNGHRKPFVTTRANLDPDGVVIVTGGTSGLGAATARHLAHQYGATKLFLLSRTGPSSAATAELVDNLKALGAKTVEVLSCDVSDRVALANALAAARLHGPITGIFHCAGAIDDGLLGEQTAERLLRVLGPKVDGAVYLDEFTRADDVKAFVLYSSAVGTLGNAAQATYAAANAMLDALAQRRRGVGLPALSIAWGPWADIGMASRLDGLLRARLKRNGLIPMLEQEALSLLDSALDGGRPHVIAARLDKAAIVRAMQTENAAFSPLLRRWIPKLIAQSTNTKPADSNALKNELAYLSVDEKKLKILNIVKSEVAQVFGLSSGAAVSPERPLKDLGLDSLLAIELRRRIATAVGAQLPISVAFDYPTPRLIAEFIAGLITPSSGVSPRVREVLKELNELSQVVLEREGLTQEILSIATRLRAQTSSKKQQSVDAVGDEDLLRLIDEELSGFRS